MQALQKFRTTYLKTRVIRIKYDLPATMTRMIVTGWLNPKTTFIEKDPMQYYEAQYLAYAVENWNVDTSGFTPAELTKFEEGKAALAEFKAVQSYIEEVSQLKFEFFTFYNNIMREIQTPTLFNFSQMSYEESIEIIKDLLARYRDALDQIEDEDWKLRFEEEIGNYLHMIYTNHCLDKDQHLFDGFDLQRFFK